MRRKEGQLLFISIERTTYVVRENRFGEESALVRKTASLFSSSCLFSSCQTWWKVCAIFAETLRQVSYYTTLELKNKTKKKNDRNPILLQSTSSPFFCMWVILPTQRCMDMSLFWMTAVRTLDVCRSYAWEGQQTGGERGSPKASGQLPTPSLDVMFSRLCSSHLPSRK